MAVCNLSSDLSAAHHRATAGSGGRSTRNWRISAGSSGSATEMEDHRDRHWCREEARRIEDAIDVEGFVERVGFASCLTDARRPGPSLYIAVCGRRDAVMPRNVQTDPEASQTWLL